MYRRKWKLYLHKRLQSTEPKSREGQGPENLYASCRSMLLLGRITGLIPFDFALKRGGATGQSGGKIAQIVGLTIMILLGAQTLVGLQLAMRSKYIDAADYFRVPQMFAFYAIGNCIYWHFYHRADKLQRLFQHWNELTCKLPLPDRNLKRDVTLITGVMMSSTVLENLVNNLRYNQPRADIIEKFGYDPKNETFLRIYYVMSCAPWAEWVSYSWPFTVYALLSDKLTWYSWNLADVLVLIFSRALYMKFKSLYEHSEGISSRKQHGGRHQEVLFWKQIAKDHHVLWRLVQESKEFLSPIIFFSIAMNTYSICLQIHFGLADSTKVTALDNIYAVWSLGHLVLRVYLICLAGSKVNEWAHKVILFMHRCPSHAITLDVIRTERFGNHNFIGWTGLDCFHVTNRLLMKVTWVVLTFEIVVLQAVDQPKHSNKQSNCD